MEYTPHIKLLRQEFEEYYVNQDNKLEKTLLEQLDAVLDAHPEDSPYARKSRMHELLCQICPVKVFRNTPLFFEMDSARPRASWGGLMSAVGSRLQARTAEHWLLPYRQAVQKDVEEGFFHGWNPVGYDHHCAGYDNLLALGIDGIIAQAEAALAECNDARKQDFYRSVIRSNRALLTLAARFREEALRLAEEAADEDARAHYLSVAANAAVVPARPPETFLQALNLILFYRECVGSVEGIGISTFAQLDRMLLPYYEADLAAGRITPAAARDLISDLLTYTEIRFDTANAYNETSTTIELGGCQRDGTPIYNELTKMILSCVLELRTMGTKINCRISKAHPDAYLHQLMEIQLSKLPCFMMHNDDVLIPARVRQGQAIEDARCYVGCGCHEIVLAGTEVCTRADSWINLPRIFLQSLRQRQDAATFEELYQGTLADMYDYYRRITQVKNRWEAAWKEYDSLPLYSSSLTGVLESGMDATEGGAKYNTTALSLVGTATVIDSLYAVKQLVFTEKRLTLPQLLEILDKDFAGEEVLRQYILHKIPKHGTNDPALNAFSAAFLEDLSSLAGQTNARGGKYLPAFYPHYTFQVLGQKTGATPDGRHAYTDLSRGVSPSEFIQTGSPLDILHSLRPIDFTRYADSFIAEITLPDMAHTPENRQILVAVVRAFLDAGGSSLQFNLIDREQLVAAKKDPKNHKNLIVRVCGYSARFVTLSPESQDEIIRRAVR